MKKTILSLALLAPFSSNVLAASSNDFPVATIDQKTITILMSDAYHNDANVNWYQTKISECKGDTFCERRYSFVYYDVMFQQEELSQVKSYTEFGKWFTQVRDNPTADDMILSRDWGEAFMGLAYCIKDTECKNWVIKKGYSTQADIDEALKYM